MSIQIHIANKVKFKVEGQVQDDTGQTKPFDFQLTCRRLKKAELTARLEGNPPVLDFMAELIEDWSGVKDAEGQAKPYSEDALRELCELPGLDGLIFRTYLAEVGAKAKN